MAFTLDFPVEKAAEKPAPSVLPDIGLAGISLNFDEGAAPGVPASEGAAESKGDQWQEVETKLDLAKAYHEMGDLSGAREILEEVLREGDTEQRESAQNLIVLLG
jgi:pilus assembly protein FimV